MSPLSRISARNRDVPAPDHTLVALVAERAERPRVEREQPPVRRRETEPASRQHSQEVPVREDEHVPLDREQLLDHAVGPSRELLDALAAQRPVAPDRPVGDLLADLRGRQPVVLAVVPLGQVVAQLGLEPGQLRRLQRSLQGAGEHQRELAPAQRLTHRARLALAFRRQWQVGSTRVPPGATPLGLPVPDENRFHSADPTATMPMPCQCQGGLTTAIHSRSIPPPCGSWATARSTCSSSGCSATSRRSAAPRRPRCASAFTVRRPTSRRPSRRSSPPSNAPSCRSPAVTAIPASSASSPSPAPGPARSAT